MFRNESSFRMVIAAWVMRASRAYSNARHALVNGVRCAISAGRVGSNAARNGLTIRVEVSVRKTGACVPRL